MKYQINLSGIIHQHVNFSLLFVWAVYYTDPMSVILDWIKTINKLMYCIMKTVYVFYFICNVRLSVTSWNWSLLDGKIEKRMLKIFQCVRRNCERIGIHCSHENRLYFDNVRIIMVYLPMIFMLISSSGFLLFGTDSPQEHDILLFLVSSSVMSIVYFSILIWRMPTI